MNQLKFPFIDESKAKKAVKKRSFSINFPFLPSLREDVKSQVEKLTGAQFKKVENESFTEKIEFDGNEVINVRNAVEFLIGDEKKVMLIADEKGDLQLMIDRSNVDGSITSQAAEDYRDMFKKPAKFS